jgi:hypothetical protein
VTRSDLAYDIISVSVDSSQNRLEVTLNNWSTSPVGYKYSDGTLFLPGVHVALFLGPETSLTNVFDGTITTCTPHFSGDGPSTLTFTATRTAPPLKQNQLTMAFGADLMTFHPTLAAKGVLECTGVTMGNPDIQPGTVLTITGVGQRFSKNYSVTKTIHAFDQKTGYTTTFSVSSRPTRTVSAEAIIRN